MDQEKGQLGEQFKKIKERYGYVLIQTNMKSFFEDNCYFFSLELRGIGCVFYDGSLSLLSSSRKIDSP